jgi:1,4-dihydroxy-2-naphthoyl-CoA hydrolase
MTDITHPSQFMSLLDIQFDELGPTRVSGSIAADERHHQPWGLVHGGLYTAAIETFATTGAYEAVKKRGQQAVSVSNVTDFLRPHRSGRLELVARGHERLQHVEPRA